MGIAEIQQARVKKFWKGLFPLLKETWSEFRKDDVDQLGAALAFYFMFSLFPLLILMLAALGLVLRHHDSAIYIRQEILRAAPRIFSPQFSQTLRQMLEVLQEEVIPATGAGLITLLWGASRVFQQLDNSFKKIWHGYGKAEPETTIGGVFSFISAKFYSIVMMLAFGSLLSVSIGLTALTEFLQSVISPFPMIVEVAGYVIGMMITLVFNTLIFALLFKYLPHTKMLWSDVLLGAAMTALLWEIAKRLLAVYIEHSNYLDAYGVVGGVLVIMAWIYFSSQMLFFGAEFTEIYSRRRGSRSSLSKGE